MLAGQRATALPKPMSQKYVCISTAARSPAQSESGSAPATHRTGRLFRQHELTHSYLSTQFIKAHFAKLGGWRLDEDTFAAETPHGMKNFTNLIFTLDPYAKRR